ncbi:MAG: cyclic pyranopterin monophosphate synthase MoaC [Candidatus Njordarchaeota archaeon]
MVKMVDISNKKNVLRIARAKGKIRLKPETIRLIKENKIEKGNVFEISKVVAISSAKKTSTLLPFCHPIEITHVDADIRVLEDGIEVDVTVKSYAKTGVEMEALVSVSIALLNIWDMVKKYEKDSFGQYPTTKIEEIIVVEKIKEDTQ